MTKSRPSQKVPEAELRREFAIDVVRRLTDAGFVALWAGGCVRDFLLGNEPTDYDVATSARPEQVRELFGYRRTLPVGASFGVIVVLGPTKQHGQIEVATFRTDAGYSDGRHPDEVTFSTPENDAHRRDFTINGMFYEPIRQETIDFVGGRADMAEGIIRAIGVPDERIAEDKLRMLRAIRFAARFVFEIDGETFEAICRHASEIAVVSAERIAAELRKTLTTNRAAWAVQRWADSRLLDFVLPTVAVSWPRIVDEATVMLNRLTIRDWKVALAALLFPIARNAADSENERTVADLKSHLRLANDEADAVSFILASQSTLEKADKLRWSRIQPLLAHANASLAVALVEARCDAGLLDRAVAIWLRSKLELPSKHLNPPPLLTGRELIELGMRPGPEFSRLIQQVRDRQLDAELKSTEEAKQWVREEAAEVRSKK